MPFIRDVFKTLEDWARRILTPPKEVKKDPFWTKEMEAWLYATDWIPVESSNIDAVWFDIFRNEAHFRFKDKGKGMRIYTVEGFSTDYAVALFRAPSKGIWYWDNVRQRGSATEHKMKYRHGM